MRPSPISASFLPLVLALLPALNLACSEEGGRGPSASQASSQARVPDDICEVGTCGGEIIGKWTIAESCLTASAYPGCDDGRIDVSEATMRGTMEFREDGTYITTVGAEGFMRMVMPVSCLMGAECKDLEVSLAAQTGDDFGDIECTLDAGVCTCAMEGRPQEKTGTYTMFGDVVVASAADSKGNVHTDMFDFCASDRTLHLGTAAGGPSPVSMSLWMTR